MCNKNCNNYAVPFATWELRLYLDTHPNDTCALELYRKFCAESHGKNNYACLPNNDCNPSRWTWIDDPWPWEIQANRPAWEE